MPKIPFAPVRYFVGPLLPWEIATATVVKPATAVNGLAPFLTCPATKAGPGPTVHLPSCEPPAESAASLDSDFEPLGGLLDTPASDSAATVVSNSDPAASDPFSPEAAAADASAADTAEETVQLEP